MEKLRVGVFGVGRGLHLAQCFMLCDAEVVAVCDHHKERLEAAVKTLDESVGVYESFDDFINHPMDAVILANSVVRSGAVVSYSIVDENVEIGANAVVGVPKDPSAEIVVLGRGITVADGVKVSEGQKHENDIRM